MCFGSSQNLQPRRPQPVSKRITQQRSNSALYTMHIYLAALASSCLLGLGVALVSVTTTVSIHTNSRIRKDTLFCNSRRTHYRSSSGRDRCGRHRSSRTSTAFALIANSPSHRGGHGASHHDDFGSSLSAASRPRQQASTNCHRSRTTTRRRKSSTTLSVFSAGAPGSPAPWASSTALYAKRRPYVDTDDDDYYPDSSRIEPPPARAFKRPFTGDEREPRRTSGPGRGRGAGPSGRAGTMAGRGVRTSGGRGVGRVSSLHATSAAGTVADAPPAQAPPAAPAVRQAGGGIPQNDPLVKGWKSAQVLLPSRDEFPSGGGRGSGQQMGGRGGETQGGFVQDFAKSGSGRSGSRGGRGGGRGGRGRGGRETPHVGMYKGADTVPWYIKEVQVTFFSFLKFFSGLDSAGSTHVVARAIYLFQTLSFLGLLL